MLEVKVKLGDYLREKKGDVGATIPTVKHEGDAGLDFYSAYDYILKPFSFQIIKTGISVEFPEGFVGLLKPKSSNDHLVGAGVVDQTYRGEILFKLFNPLSYDRVIRAGDPVGQMIFVRNESPKVILTEESLSDTERGSEGGIVTQWKNRIEREGDVWIQGKLSGI